MSKYYDLDKLKDMIEAKAETLIGDGAIAFHAVAKWLDYLPAADVAPVRHAHWMFINGHLAPMFKCSNCRNIAFNSPYCPSCGAEMDEETEK